MTPHLEINIYVQKNWGAWVSMELSKTFWKIESPNAISWIHLGGTAKKIFF